MQVKGIGQWTVDMFLIFHLGRPDVLPVGDLGLRRAAMIEYRLRKLPEPPRLMRLARPWRPWRSVATWYLWASLRVQPPSWLIPNPRPTDDAANLRWIRPQAHPCPAWA